LNPLQPTSSSPAIAVEEEADLHRELPRPHRTLAFEGVAAEVAIGCSPSTGDTPRPLQLPELRSPSTTTAAEGKPSQIRPPIIHKAHSLLCLHQAKGQRAHLPTSRPPRAPEHPSQGSPSALERSAD